MDLDSCIPDPHCLYRVRSVSFLILKTSTINSSSGQTISSLRRSLVISIAYKGWLFVCSFQQPHMPLFLMQTPCLLVLPRLACFSLCLGWVFWWLSSVAFTQEPISLYLQRVPPNQRWVQHHRAQTMSFPLSLCSATQGFIVVFGVFLIEYVVHIGEIQNKPIKQINQAPDGSHF